MENEQQVNLFGISGKAGVGKDLVGKIIQFFLANEEGKGILKNKDIHEFLRIPDKGEFKTIYTGGWEIKKFAKKVKEILSILTGIPVEDFESQTFKNKTIGELIKENRLPTTFLKDINCEKSNN